MLDVCVITYIAESWTLTTEVEKKIDACEKGWLSRLLRTNYRDRIKEIKERTKLIQLSIRIRRMRMKWTGHILRK